MSLQLMDQLAKEKNIIDASQLLVSKESFSFS